MGVARERDELEVGRGVVLQPGREVGSRLVEGRREDLATRPGRFGWTGGLGTTAATDPSEDLVGVLFTQTALPSPTLPRVFQDFWTTAYAAIDD